MAQFPEELTNVFEIKEHLNFGAHGNIYRVIKRSNFYPGNQKNYAMKAVDWASTASSWKDIETEMQILSWANPYKLNLDCFFVDGDNLFMIIDYCSCSNLLEAIAYKIHIHELFEEDEIWKYFIQICFGLESLNYNRFIHRDLNPQNILLDENKNIKIADFGFSRSLQTKISHGVFACQSPSTHIGGFQAKEYDAWAAGCILYYLCSLEHPFGDNVNNINYELWKPIRSEYSDELRYFVDWCLKEQRIERLTILDILTNLFIINKTQSLGITIPEASVMNAAICQIQLNKERERNEQLEKELYKYRKENMVQKNEIELANLEIARLNNIINKKSKSLKWLENVQEPIEQKTESELSFLNSQMSSTTKDINRKLKETESALNAIDTLRNKTAEILNRLNDPKFEMDFRTTCSEYQRNSSLYDPLLIQAYQDCLNSYQQKTSLYSLYKGANKNRTILVIYNTETESQEEKILQTPEALCPCTCITQLPNGKLFCFGNSRASGITLVIDVNKGVEVLPSGIPCSFSSCIYFNNHVYCFGGANIGRFTLSNRFDLDLKRWNQLTPLPKADCYCNSIIFNGNILISGLYNRNLWLYSIDIDSFSTIPYEFAAEKRKILINAERLYLIECPNGSIYESEIGSDTNWRLIADSAIKYKNEVYWSYNKGGIFISTSDWYKNEIEYWNLIWIKN